MNMEQLVEWAFAGEIELLGENLPQCRFVLQKSHMTWPGIEPGPSRWESIDYTTPDLWHGIVKEFGFRFFSFSGCGETESTWYVGHC
jgi:hypothetical protein